jgi:hypothetical protein
LAAARTHSDYQQLRHLHEDSSQHKRDAENEEDAADKSNKDDKVVVNLQVDRSARNQDDAEAAAVVDRAEEARLSMEEDSEEDKGKSRSAAEAEKTQREESKQDAAAEIDRVAVKRNDEEEDDDRDDDVRQDLGDEEQSKREEANQDLVAQRSAQKRDRSEDNSRAGRQRKWIAHPGTIILIVALSVFLFCTCVYFLTPVKSMIDRKLPDRPVIGGEDSILRSKLSRNKSNDNSSYNAAPSDADKVVSDFKTVTVNLTAPRGLHNKFIYRQFKLH